MSFENLKPWVLGIILVILPKITGAAITCPNGAKPVNCFVNPCTLAICEDYPNAVCEADYCMGCNTKWTWNGTVVNCGEENPCAGAAYLGYPLVDSLRNKIFCGDGENHQDCPTDSVCSTGGVCCAENVNANETCASLHSYYTCHQFADCHEDDGEFTTCTCKEGYQGDGLKGEGHIGCQANQKSCTEDSTCLDLNAKCIDGFCACPEGYEQVLGSQMCEDIDECALKKCDPHANCHNSPGNYTCTCKATYEGTGYGPGSCAFRCGVEEDCSANETCTFKQCVCKSGYERNDDGNCEDIDECSASPYPCVENTDCVNVVGHENEEKGHICTCKEGYHGNPDKECIAYPRTCHEILQTNNKSKSGKYVIDPDGPGGEPEVEVYCKMYHNPLLALTRVDLKRKGYTFYHNVREHSWEYKIPTKQVETLADISGYCDQKLYSRSRGGFHLLNNQSDSWTDSRGNTYHTWSGSKTYGKCGCGEVFYCTNATANCNADGDQNDAVDEGTNIYKESIPLVSVQLNPPKGQNVFVRIEPVWCSPRPLEMPRSCDEKKQKEPKTKNGPLIIDVDGPEGPLMPILVYCNMEEYPHVGITTITHDLHYETTIKTSTGERELVYTQTKEVLEAIIENAKYCRQKVKYTCKNSAVSDDNTYFLDQNGDRLDSFPGGQDGKCACGLTKTCANIHKDCNCDTKDGKVRYDIGTHDVKGPDDKNTYIGWYAVNDVRNNNHRGGLYIGSLECSGQEFGYEKDCQGYIDAGYPESYTYKIDPDGPAPRVTTGSAKKKQKKKKGGNRKRKNFPPFYAQCIMHDNPKYAETVIHHDTGEASGKKKNHWSFHYMFTTQKTLKTLVNQSPYCAQTVTYKCNSENESLYKPNGEATLSWEGRDGDIHTYLDGYEGTGCACQKDNSCQNGNSLCNCEQGANGTDMGTLRNKVHLPVSDLYFNESDGIVELGPLKCYDLFPSCEDLLQYRKERKLESESDVTDGTYTILLPLPTGAEPREVVCAFPHTIVKVDKTPEVITNTNDSSPVSKCFEIQYNGGVTPEEILALKERSAFCKQKVIYRCKNAPKTDKVSYRTCDGEDQSSWASEGKPMCKCGVTGDCEETTSKCNCDIEDGKERVDEGWIHDMDLLPVCTVCMSLDAATDEAPEREASYELSDLYCGPEQTGTYSSCQQLRDENQKKNLGLPDDTYLIDFDGPGQGYQPQLMHCHLSPHPPNGVAAVKPKNETIIVPDNETEIDIKYYVFNILAVKAMVNVSVYCEQEVYFMCDISEARPDSRLYRHRMSDLMQTNDGEITCPTCTCDGVKRLFGGYIVSKSALPLVKFKRPEGPGGKLEIGEMNCYDVYRDCEHIRQNDKDTNPNGNDKYAIDPDGAAGVEIFEVECDFGTKPGVGATKVKTNISAEIEIIEAEDPQSRPVEVTYNDVTEEQITKLIEVSEFCYQNVKYECTKSPITGSTALVGGGNLTAAGFGTGPYTDLPGCSCLLTGYCSSCYCDAQGPMAAYDYGTISDSDFLPVTALNAGGQTASDAMAKFTVSDLTCAPEPVGFPKDCVDVMDQGLGTGDHAIKPTDAVDPFFVHCDIDNGKAITTIKTNRENQTEIDYSTTTTIDVTYMNVTYEQAEALVAVSSDCYMAVVYNCYNTEFKMHWYGRENRMFEYLGTSDNTKKECTCGNQDKCGGNETEAVLRQRKCNCDAGDAVWRRDGGVFKNKEDLPPRKFVFEQLSSQTAKGNFAIGELRCSRKNYPPNECEMTVDGTPVHDCDPLATCRNTGSDFTCSCKKGYQGRKVENVWANGRACFDDNECLEGRCPSHSSNCTNTPGSYYCTCFPGYRDDEKKVCIDIDECKENIHNCHPDADCINQDGTFKCRCKYGYFGDGYNCTSVGLCTCFGDPHCQSFDQKWLHFQGQCEYLLAKDGCDGVSAPTFEVYSTFWEWMRGIPAATQVKQSRVRLQRGNSYDEIEFLQNHEVRVNGITVTVPYPTSNSGSSGYYIIRRTGAWTNMKTHIGLEINWDGSTVFEILLVNSYQGHTCGICGNYNLDPDDDWTVGDFCPDDVGQITTNANKLGYSWTNSEFFEKHACDSDCNAPPPKKVCDTKEEKERTESECNELFKHAKFRDCLKAMNNAQLNDLKKSCYYDVCLLPEFTDDVICGFAMFVVRMCREYYDTNITDWRAPGYCEIPCDEETQVYLDNGDPSNSKSCFDAGSGLPSVTGSVGLEEGCFCKEGYMLEGDKCVRSEDCGCVYKGQYIPKGQNLVLEECKSYIKCVQTNKTVRYDLECHENATCGIQDGVFACHCNKGYIGDGSHCRWDPCGDGPCDHLPHAYCEEDGKNFVCKCKMGFTGDCDSCTDIDECKTSTFNCTHHAECVNTIGSYTCNCRTGFQKKNGKCIDINECEKKSLNNCEKSNLKCQNTIGSYKCAPCQNDHPEMKCCFCRGYHCVDDGEVCGADGEDYSSEEAMALAYCETNRPWYAVKVNYPGPCKDSCDNIDCGEYKECKTDPDTFKTTCECKPCNETENPINKEPVCDANLVYYETLCDFKNAMCVLSRNITYSFDITPCQKKSGDTPVGDWGPWSPCTQTCGTGTKTRTRNQTKEGDMTEYETDAYPLNITEKCYNPPCQYSPCLVAGCNFTFGEVCEVDDIMGAMCFCRNCTYEDEEPVCVKVGNRNRNFKNPCLAQKTACEQNLPYDILYKGKCGTDPVNCEVRPYYQLHKSADKQCSSQVNIKHCMGGCTDMADECCRVKSYDHVSIDLTCKNNTKIEQTVKIVAECECKDITP